MHHFLQVQNGASSTAIISACVTVLVALLGIFGNWYLANQNKKKELLIKNKEIEQKEYLFLLENLKSFWETQNGLYAEALKTVAKLTFIDDTRSEEFLAADNRFQELYYGELPTCESGEVEGAMVQVMEVLSQKKQLDPADKEGLVATKEGMQILLLGLSQAIRSSSLLLKYSEKLKEKIETGLLRPEAAPHGS